MSANGVQSLSQALAGLVTEMTAPWRNSDEENRSDIQRFALLWIGAMTFLVPLYIVRVAMIIADIYTVGPMHLAYLVLAGVVLCAVASVFVGWLALSKRKGQSKVRLYLTGFLLPYVVVVLLMPVLELEGIPR